MGRELPVFILRGDKKKIFVGSVTLHEDEPGNIAVGRISEPLYIEHPERGDLEIIEQPRFISGVS